MSVAPEEQIDYSKLKSNPVDVAGPPLPPPSQFRDPMSRQLLEERMNPQPQLGTQTEKSLTDRQLLDKYLSDKFMREDIAGANTVSDKAQLYAGLGGAFNALNKGLTGFETDPNAYQLMHKGGMEAPSKVLAERQAMRENLLKKYGLGIQEKESEARLKEAQANNAYRNKMLEIENAKLEIAKGKGTPVQQEIQKKDAETVADWNSSKRDAYESGMRRLEEIKNKLDTKKDGMFDRIRGSGPNAFMTQEQLEIKQNVINAALPALKATFGSQISDAELRNQAEALYDPKLPSSINAKNITAKMEEAYQAAETKEALANKYGQGSGKPLYKPAALSSSPTQQTQATQPGAMVVKAIRKADGKPVTLKGTQQEVDEALKSGAYEAR